MARDVDPFEDFLGASGVGLPVDDGRARYDVGRRVRLPSLGGVCLGDDVTWKGSRVTRVAAVQTQGSSGSREEWGHHWGGALASLGADVGALTETRIMTSAQHTAAENGLLRAGFLAVSQNCDVAATHRAGCGPDPRQRRGLPVNSAAPLGEVAQGPRASGVVIAIRWEYTSSGWTHVARGPHGRALAGCVQLMDGSIMMILAAYGVSGVCASNFASTRRVIG